MKAFQLIMDQIGYQFKNIKIIDEALRHSSFVNEQNDKNLNDNERLEFLGDAVLSLAVSHLLMIRYPGIDEGELSKMRANLVNESKLGEIARSLDLGHFVKFGKGELQSKGNEKQSILADAFEAVIAAVYLDGGYDNTFRIIRHLFKEHLDNLDNLEVIVDYKSRLQEMAQVNQIPIPHYEIIREIGPDHDKTFLVKLTMGGIVTEGNGKNKKAAEQNAAGKAFKAITGQKTT